MGIYLTPLQTHTSSIHQKLCIRPSIIADILCNQNRDSASVHIDFASKYIFLMGI